MDCLVLAGQKFRLGFFSCLFNYLSLSQLYFLRFVCKKFLVVVNSYKRFQKYFLFTNEMCDFKVMVSYFIWYIFLILRDKEKNENKRYGSSYICQKTNFFLCLIIWLFIMFLNILCFAQRPVCSRVYFKDISVNNLCKNMFLKVYLKKKTVQNDLLEMLLEDDLFLFLFGVGLLNQKYLYAVQTRKNGCMFYKACSNPTEVFSVFTEIMLRIYLNRIAELGLNLCERFSTTEKLILSFFRCLF